MKNYVLKSDQYSGFVIDIYDNFWMNIIEYTVFIPDFEYLDYPSPGNWNWTVDENNMAKPIMVPKRIKARKFKITIPFDSLMKVDEETVGNVLFNELPPEYRIEPVFKMFRSVFPEKPKPPTYDGDLLFAKFIKADKPDHDITMKSDGFKVKWATIQESKNSPQLLANELPGVYHEVTCPVTGEVGPLRSVIIYLNDKEQWTREQIADWLEEISDPTGVNGPDIRFRSSND